MLGSPRRLERIKKLEKSKTQIPGAVVIGGDYQGLGIVRSLGRKGIPICILDDEYSISRYSRYATYGIRVPDLRNENNVVETLVYLGRQLNLRGWVLFPTRDELVATLSRHKAALSEVFRVPTPAWETVKWVWNKRNTYRLAHELKMPIPESWFPDTLSDLDEITTPFPSGPEAGRQRELLIRNQSQGLACRYSDSASGIIRTGWRK